MNSAAEGTSASVCIVCPCYNEEAVIDQFYLALVRVLNALRGLDIQLLFVDDGSKDGTLARLNAIAAEDDRVGVLSLSRNFGHQIALTAGLDAADADAVIMMDSDLQHPPTLIPQMLDKWQQGFDVVSAVRRSTADATLSKWLTSRAFYYLLNKFGDTEIIPGAADFCLLSRRAHQALCSMPERHRFLRGMVSWIGFSRATVPYSAAARGAGESKYTFRRMLRFAMDAAFSFSTAPVKLATRVGAAIAVCGFAYLAYVVIRYLAIGDLVTGWSSLICTLLILGGIQLTFTGIIGEYIARVFEEAKQRPLYFLKQSPAARCSSVRSRQHALETSNTE